jgi:hypothetical protein
MLQVDYALFCGYRLVLLFIYKIERLLGHGVMILGDFRHTRRFGSHKRCMRYPIYPITAINVDKIVSS